jgi:hypothetical protein
MFILCHAAKNEPRKRAKTFLLGTPLVRAKTEPASGLYIFAKLSIFSACARILTEKCGHKRRTQ